MNDKLDKVRLRVTARLDINLQKRLKGLRFIFLLNLEDLPEDDKLLISKILWTRGDAICLKKRRE